jgi:gliding motility-associated-like protein
LNGNTQPPCGTNPPAGEDCANATPICELNGYCGNTYSYAPDAWGTLEEPFGCGFLGLGPCPGTGLLNVFCGSVENDSYLKFVASATSISFDVWVTSSVYGDGIQLIVFSTPSCGNNTVNAPYCQQILPGAGATNVSVSGLIVGNTYYIMIDGFAGDLCDYVIGANTGIAIPVDVTPLTSTICNGDNVNLTASGGNGTYTWNASADLNITSGASVVATPPGVGTYTYTVNSATGNPLCPSSTLAVATIIVNNCGCAVNATNSGDICVGGGLIDLFTSNVANATYSWTGPGGFTSTSQNPTGITPPAIAGSYNYIVTTTVLGVPCSSTTTLVVNPLPTVSAGTYSSVCSDDPDVALVGSPVGGTFSGTGVTGSNFDPSVETQTITYSYTDGNGCSNTASTSITSVSPSSINAGTYSAVCVDASNISLVGSPLAGTFSGTGVSGNSFDPSVGTQTVTYTYFDAGGCGGSATTTITVNQLPIVSAGSYSAVCSNAAVVPLVGSPVGGTFSGTGVTGNNFNPASGTQTLTYNFTDGNGCSNSATASITVNNLPVVTSGNYGPYCVDAANVSLVGTPAGGTFSGTGVTLNSFDPSVGNQTVVYTYTDINGCVNSANTAIQINQLPNINAGTDIIICFGTSVTLTGSGGATYTWDGAINGQTFTPSIGNTIYTVTGTDINGCINTDAVSINVLPLPIADMSSDVNIGNPVLTVTFTNTSSNSVNYIWNFGNGITISNSLSNQTNSYTNEGNYLVTLTASNGICSDIDSLYIDVIPFPAPIVHVPNVFTPNQDGANDEFFIDTKYASQIEIVILNRWGNVVFESTDLNEKWTGDVKGDPASDGVYFFKYIVTGVNSDIIQGHGNITLIR